MIGSICLFLLGAGVGAFLVVRHFRRRGLPGWLAVAHGVAGGAGFFLLLYFCSREPTFLPARYALGILVVAIALGCVNVVYHLRRVRHRTAFVVAHAVAALAGVGTLTYGAVLHASSPVPVPIAIAIATAVPIATASEPIAPPAGAMIPPTPVKTSAALRPGIVWSDRAIEFDTNAANLSEASLGALAAIADELRSGPDARLVEVQGHADARGFEATNMQLAHVRAVAVVDALVEQGVARSRLRAAGYGSRCASVSTNHDDAVLRRDRRVTFVLVEAGQERFRGPLACARMRGEP